MTTIAEGGASSLVPIAGRERIEAMDILRGFALFGIFAVNITGFGSPSFVPGYAGVELGPLDGLAAWITDNLFTFKFFTLFSFLFGVGFAVQLSRADASGRDFRAFYARRLFILLCVGVLHHALFWEGDILKLYALFGFCLLPFRKAKDRTILGVAALSWLVSVGVLVFSATMDTAAGAALGPDPVEAARAAYGAGGFLDAVAYRVREMPLVTLFLLVEQGFAVFSLFLFGLFVGRRRCFERLGEFARLPGFTLVAALLGGALTLAANLLEEWPAALAGALANTAASAAYAGLVLLAAREAAWKPRLAPFAAVGRMALTNYVAQSVVAGLFFYGYGLGRYEKLGPAACLGFVVLVYSAQVALSSWWLKRFRFGPLEWAWRSLTYGKPQPFLREADRAESGTR